MQTPEIALDFEPDWGSLPEVSYSFDSVVQGTPRLVEQRRPLLPTPIRSVKYDFTLSDEEAQRLVNVLTYGASKFICVPIFSEPLLANTITQGASSIIVTQDVSNLWNIQNCDWAVIIDFVNREAEMLSVSSASGTTITLAGAIVGAFVAARCAIYPAFAGIVMGFDRTPVSDFTHKVTAEFEETPTEHAEAVGSWVGIDGQICPEDI